MSRRRSVLLALSAGMGAALLCPASPASAVMLRYTISLDPGTGSTILSSDAANADEISYRPLVGAFAGQVLALMPGQTLSVDPAGGISGVAPVLSQKKEVNGSHASFTSGTRVTALEDGVTVSDYHTDPPTVTTLDAGDQHVVPYCHKFCVKGQARKGAASPPEWDDLVSGTVTWHKADFNPYPLDQYTVWLERGSTAANSDQMQFLSVYTTLVAVGCPEPGSSAALAMALLPALLRRRGAPRA